MKLANKWLEIYKAKFQQLRSEGYIEDQATKLAGKFAYEECDKLAKRG